MDAKEAAQFLAWMRMDKTEEGSPMYHALTAGIDALQAISEPPKSNGDRIRRMTDEQITEMLDIYAIDEICDFCIKRDDPPCHNTCYKGILAWLKQEVKEDAEMVEND